MKEKYRNLIQKHAPKLDFRLVAYHDREELKNWIEDQMQNLTHLQETSQVILRQLENLLSLVSFGFGGLFRWAIELNLNKAFNIETVTQGQAVARLNIVAIVFLPLSFVAV